MATHAALPFLSLLLLFINLPSLITAQSNCGGPCGTLNDCYGQLICINGQCNDDPNVGAHTCSSLDGADDGCQQSGNLVCSDATYPTYSCSPPITSPTRAILTHNNFEKGGDGGDASKCDESFHDNTESVVALSTGWYQGGSLCGKMISIAANNGKTTTATVVDECDSMHGCDKEHDGQPPCDNNIVDGSDAVWKALELDIDKGRVDITWSMGN